MDCAGSSWSKADPRVGSFVGAVETNLRLPFLRFRNGRRPLHIRRLASGGGDLVVAIRVRRATRLGYEDPI